MVPQPHTILGCKTVTIGKSIVGGSLKTRWSDGV